ncbi:HNH endonuclease signature motif containing protein [Arthrobacter sp. R4-81]
MEAVGEHAPNQATRLGLFSNARFHQESAFAVAASSLPGSSLPGSRLPGRAALRAVPSAAASQPGVVPEERAVPVTPALDGGVSGAVAASLELLGTAQTTAAGELALSGFTDAADFAGQVEELSRTVEYLQVLAAAAVDRTRHEAARPQNSTAAGSTNGWTTGWGTETPETSPGSAVPAGDGCRNTAEFLRARLRISAVEARRRLALAAALVPTTGITGQPIPPAREELATALATGTIPSRAATIITLALERAQHIADPHTLARMEHALTRTAATEDQDFLTRITRRWADAIDQDGAEPSEEELRHRQGAFIRPTRRGLHHLEIFATTDQFENLLTAMNTATNPRLHTPPEPGTPGATVGEATETPAAATAAETGERGTTTSVDGATREPVALDRRTRPQQLLDGLIGACKTALTTTSLPAAGGLRPQIMVTIDYRDLLTRLPNPTQTNASTSASTSADDETGPGTGSGSGTGTFAFTGPVTASTIRKIACDADIIPILLGSEGRILDIGRTTRIFPPHIRKAITARDQGCTFPGCTIPAPWCEAHHTTYWSHNGPTSTENGTLLCTHHHHLIHKEQWTIHMPHGIPWFIPPPHIDPTQQPRQNHYFHQ